jgi:hypothetical protein
MPPVTTVLVVEIFTDNIASKYGVYWWSFFATAHMVVQSDDALLDFFCRTAHFLNYGE